ncbi:MAG: MFS transporter [Actinomycetota bacterium]|nr:MFS transporter [Actinomycetota bacterium]
MRSLLRYPAFVVLWCANLASSLAGWSLGIALSVQVFETTRSPLATSALLIASSLPSAVLGSVAGVIADRVSRTRLLQLVSWLRVGIIAVLPLTHGAVGALYLVAIAQATAMQFFGPAEQATVAQVVPDRLLPLALGANSAATNTTRLVAPALGGGLITLFGFSWTTAIVAGLLGCAAVLLCFLPAGSAKPQGVQPLWRDWLDGIHELRANRTTTAVTAVQLLDAVKEGALTALFPVLMLGVIGVSPAYMGVVNSSFAVTAIGAGLAVPAVVRRCGYRWPIAVGVTVSGLLIVLLGAIPLPIVALGAFFVSGFPFTISWVAANTLLLVRTEESHRARTVGVVGGLYSAVMLMAAAIAGVAASLFGTPAVLIAAAGFQVAAGPIFALMLPRASRLSEDLAPGRRQARPSA